jgi:hypothetical protein
MNLADFSLPLYFDAPGDAGGGGGEGGTSFGGGAGSGAPAEPATPTVYEVDDNSLIKPKGFEKPVKYGEHVRGLQGQFTRASQEAARLKAQVAEYQNKVQQFEQQQRAQQQSQAATQGADVYGQLEALPYLSGKDARAVVEAIQGAILQRDQVLMAALKKIQSMEKTLGGLNENHSMQSFEGKIAKWLQDGGYDAGYADLAKEIYLAYEGDDLDTEFPQIFAGRVKQIEDLMERSRSAKLNAARRQPFVPGRGGNTGPSQPLKLDPRASHQQVADALWDSIQEGSGT